MLKFAVQHTKLAPVCNAAPAPTRQQLQRWTQPVARCWSAQQAMVVLALEPGHR
jgi:hypothetical protein